MLCCKLVFEGRLMVYNSQWAPASNLVEGVFFPGAVVRDGPDGYFNSCSNVS
jgi:hypothetical protein